MRYVALASDYDGTLAHDGRVPDRTIEALQRFRQSGRKLILVTGRNLPDLLGVFPRLDLFDCAVVENGAVLYTPATREKVDLAAAANPAFVEELRRRGVDPDVGDCIVSTWQPHETVVLETIRDLGLDLQVIFNKGAVMVLPSGVNKRSGLKAALETFGISEHNTIGVGDAENDHPFLKYCEVSVAVANSHPAIKETATFTTKADHGDGVVELIGMVFDGTLPNPRFLPVGHDDRGEASIPAYGDAILVSGASGSGKSTFVAGLLEVLTERKYQFCLIDPEGDYEAFPSTIPAGDEKHPPSVDEVLQILQKPTSETVTNLMGVALAERPAFFGNLLPRLQEMRMRLGRPHWIIVDEAHHMIPPEWTPASAGVSDDLRNMILITVHLERLPAVALRDVRAVFAVGPEPGKVLDAFASVTGIEKPAGAPSALEPGEVLAWFVPAGELRRLSIRLSQADRKRHKRNYAHGELPEDQSFYFRGPGEKLNLRAQNLSMFLQLGDGVDDETWMHHLKQGDYSQWLRMVVKDEEVAGEVEQVERDNSLDARQSRERIRGAIEERYTAPA
jgi:HAD superfamily hydrolase (TIGR01484 family)